MAEIRSAGEGEKTISDQRLIELNNLVRAWATSPPENYSGPLWSELRADLRRHFTKRDLGGDSALAQASAGNDYTLSDTYERKGLRDEALSLLESASGLYADKNPYLPLLLLHYADLLRDSGRLDEAQPIIERASRTVGAAENPFSITAPMVLLGRAHIYLSMGMNDLAFPVLERGFAAANSDKARNAALFGLAVFRRVLLADALEDYELQNDYVLEFERLCAADRADAEAGGEGWRHEVPDATRAAILMRLGFGRAELELRGKEVSESAEATILRTLEIPSISGMDRYRGWAWLANSQLDRREIERAAESLDRAAELLSEVSGERFLERVEFSSLRARLALAAGTSPADLKSLLDKDFMPTWEQFLEDWSQAPLRKAGIAFLQHTRRKAVVDHLLTTLLAAHGEAGPERALHEVLRIQSYGSAARELSLRVPAMEDLRGVLGELQEGLLLWVPGRQRSHVFAIDKESVTHHTLGPDFELRAAARNFSTQLRTTLRRPTAEATKSLEAHRLAATRAFLPSKLTERIESWNGIVLVGLGDFGELTFEALGPEPGAFGKRMRTTYWPSIPLGLYLHRRSESLGARTAVSIVATGEPGRGLNEGDFPPLLVQPEALRKVVSGLAVSPSVIFAHEAENLGVRAELRRGGASILHLWAHGTYDSSRERPAGLLLDPKAGLAGRLFASDVDDGEHAPPIVFLTACGVGRARRRRGEDGRALLSGAFFRAGSSCVVDATTDVELNASLNFYEHVYVSLAGGARISEAMRVARNEATPELLGVAALHSSLMRLTGNGALKFRAEKK